MLQGETMAKKRMTAAEKSIEAEIAKSIATTTRRREAERLTALSKLDAGSLRAHLRAALVSSGGVVTVAAEDLGINVRQLWRLIDKDRTVLEGTGHKINKALQGVTNNDAT